MADVYHRRMRKSFKTLTAWQGAMDLVVLTYELTKRLPVDERFGLVTQLRKSAVSIPSNIAEGHGRNKATEFAHFLGVAMGSIREHETQTLLIVRLDYISARDAQASLACNDRVAGDLAALLRKVRVFD